MSFRHSIAHLPNKLHIAHEMDCGDRVTVVVTGEEEITLADMASVYFQMKEFFEVQYSSEMGREAFLAEMRKRLLK